MTDLEILKEIAQIASAVKFAFEAPEALERIKDLLSEGDEDA